MMVTTPPETEAPVPLTEALSPLNVISACPLPAWAIISSTVPALSVRSSAAVSPAAVSPEDEAVPQPVICPAAAASASTAAVIIVLYLFKWFTS